MDLTITKDQDKENLEIDIYRKEIKNYITINKHFNHLWTQKIAAFKYYIKRAIDYLKNDKEMKTIKHIAVANGYDDHLIDRLKVKIENTYMHKVHITLTNYIGQKQFAVFNYNGPITKL